MNRLWESKFQKVDTHVWCESDGNNGVVKKDWHHVYENTIRINQSSNEFCDGTRATHTPLYRRTT